MTDECQDEHRQVDLDTAGMQLVHTALLTHANPVALQMAYDGWLLRHDTRQGVVSRYIMAVGAAVSVEHHRAYMDSIKGELTLFGRLLINLRPPTLRVHSTLEINPLVDLSDPETRATVNAVRINHALLSGDELTALAVVSVVVDQGYVEQAACILQLGELVHQLSHRLEDS